MDICARCGSHSINHHLHGRDGSDDDLCDVCYWRKRAEQETQVNFNNRMITGKIDVWVRDSELPEFLRRQA